MQLKGTSNSQFFKKRDDDGKKKIKPRDGCSRNGRGERISIDLRGVLSDGKKGGAPEGEKEGIEEAFPS